MAQFRREAGIVAAAVGNGEDPAKAVKAQRKQWATLYGKVYVGVAGDFAPATISTLKGVRPEMVKADEWLRFVTEYLRRYSGARIRGVEETTQKLIAAALAEGVDAGEGTDKLARRVRDSYDMFSRYRSERIARTEVVSASNLGSRAGALSTGLDLQHRWLSTRDDRTRDAHMAVDGQVQGMDQPYTVEGEQLMFPGDTSLGASAGNIINCRCAETFTAK